MLIHHSNEITRKSYRTIKQNARNTCNDFYKPALYIDPMTENIGKRIERLLEVKNGGNQSELARLVGVTPQAVQQWISGVTSPKGKNLSRAAAFFGITPAELQFGSQKDAANVSSAALGSRQIPLISYVQAGVWSEAVDPYQPGDASDWLLTDLDLSENAFALEIKGDSMLPEFKEGDRVIVDPQVSPSPGDFVVAKNGKGATFKKYRPRGVNEHGEQIFELVPLNPDYETLRSDYTEITIIGTMMEHRKYRKR